MRHRIKYPKLLLIALTIIIAVILFHEARDYKPLHDFLLSIGYFGTFIGGIFYAYGFTAAPATAILLVLSEKQNIFLACLIAGSGALISDLLIFLFIKNTLKDELNKLEHEPIVKDFEHEERKIFGKYYMHIFPAFAGFLIASPLPTEMGVAIMARQRKISLKKFLVIAWILHTIGILIVLSIGTLMT
jgi:uncharacterized membrane protein YdjX (TVP38/TMEM64 family)